MSLRRSADKCCRASTDSAMSLDLERVDTEFLFGGGSRDGGAFLGGRGGGGGDFNKRFAPETGLWSGRFVWVFVFLQG